MLFVSISLGHLYVHQKIIELIKPGSLKTKRNKTVKYGFIREPRWMQPRAHEAHNVLNKYVVGNKSP